MPYNRCVICQKRLFNFNSKHRGVIFFLNYSEYNQPYYTYAHGQCYPTTENNDDNKDFVKN